MTPICLMLAASQNIEEGKGNIIGNDGGLPWGKLKDDMRHFVKMTKGKPIIMGRKTFDSIGNKPLPNRPNIVVSRDNLDYTKFNTFENSGTLFVTNTIQEAIGTAEVEAEKSGAEEIIIIGGAEIYKQFLPHASKVYFTMVHANVEGDTFFDIGELLKDCEVTEYIGAYPQNDDNEHGHSIMVLMPKDRTTIKKL